MYPLGEYHDLFLKTNVLLLADVFENFRSLCLRSYHLDSAHYYTSPGLAWDAMICKKYSKANNPQVPDYDPSKPNTWITYLDMNNLNGVSISDTLPKEDFAWLSEEQIQSLDISNIADNAETGYILEADLEYPNSQHNQDSDLPVAPETITVTNDMVFSHSHMLRKKLSLKGKSSKNLVPNLSSKTKYVVHYRNLKYYLSHGLKLKKKIHRVLGFTQSAWLKPYIDFNTQKRMMASTAFNKDFYKLMNNAVFGKTMENMRKRLNVELVNTKRLKKVCAKPNFQSFKIVNDDLVAVNMKKYKYCIK